METGNEKADGNIAFWASMETGAALDKMVHDRIISSVAKVLSGEAVVPPYSADLQNTLDTVVEIMRMRGYSFSLTSVCHVSSFSWGWEARFIRSVFPPRFIVKGDEMFSEGIGWQSDNAATAVCIAALRVMEMESREMAASGDPFLPLGGAQA